MSTSEPTGIPVTITNKLDFKLIVYNSVTPTPVTNPPSTNPLDYLPVYTQIATVPANGTTTFTTPSVLSRLVICQGANDFPLQLFVPSILAETASTTVTATDQQNCASVWAFYKAIFAQPYSPEALQFNELFLNVTDVSTLESEIATFFNNNSLPGCTYGQYSIVSYWATNSLYAWQGTYYCYLPESSSSGLIANPASCGTLTVAGSIATYLPITGSGVPSLSFVNGLLSSTGATTKSGMHLTAIPRSLAWEGKSSSTVVLCFVGTLNGTSLIAQPYAGSSLPWWVAAYNMSYISFQTVQLALALKMAVDMLEGVANGISYLSSKISDFINSGNEALNTTSESADSVASSVGGEMETVNVDVDVDVDVDIDVDTDTDEDTDVDVDIDIDVDIDDDVFAVIDVDVDVDVDIDTDVVTDIDNVTDVVTDTDIDTDVNVEPGMVQSTVSQLGRWIMTTGFPMLAKNLAIAVVMTGTQELLAVWKTSDEEALQPAQSTGLGLLVNYMLNANNSVNTRWTTFADYVQQGTPDIGTQQMLLTSVVMTKSAADDKAAKSWSWPSSAETSLINQMAKYTTSANQYQAYQVLASYTYNSQPLPIKVGCNMALKYLAKIS